MITGMPRIAIAVTDFEHTIETLKEGLGLPVIDLTPGSVETLGAKLAMCVPDGGSNIEIMATGNPETPLSQSLERFLARRGEGHFALMLESADPNLEAEELLERGLNVLPLMEGAGGRDVHPNSTHGVLIRVYPTNSFVEKVPGHDPGAHPTGLTGITRALIAVKNLDEATTTYGAKFALNCEAASTDPNRGLVSSLCHPATGGTIELISPEDTSKALASEVEHFLASRGEGLYALILQTKDLSETRAALNARAFAYSDVPGLEGTIELDPGRTSGARFWVEQA